MSELVIPPGYVLLTHSLQHTGNNHTALVTIGGKVEAAPFTQQNCTDHSTIFYDALKTLYDSEVIFSRTVALVGNDGPPIRFEKTSSAAGTRAAQTTLPPAVSVVVRKVTSFAGRQYRGRMYLPFPSTLDIGQGGSWLSGRQAAWQTQLDALFSGMTTGTGNNLNEVTLLHSPPKVGSTPSPTAITALLVTGFAGTQRRRQLRV